MLIVALLFGCWSIYGSVWANHCQRHEESLIQFVAQEKLESVQDFVTRDRIYLAKGIPGDLKFLDSDFIKKVGVAGIVPGRPNPDSDVFYVGKINWISWDTVCLKYGLIYWGAHEHYFEGAKFQLVNGNWLCIEDGDGYVILR